MSRGEVRRRLAALEKQRDAAEVSSQVGQVVIYTVGECPELAPDDRPIVRLPDNGRGDRLKEAD